MSAALFGSSESRVSLPPVRGGFNARETLTRSDEFIAEQVVVGASDPHVWNAFTATLRAFG